MRELHWRHWYCFYTDRWGKEDFHGPFATRAAARRACEGVLNTPGLAKPRTEYRTDRPERRERRGGPQRRRNGG